MPGPHVDRWPEHAWLSAFAVFFPSAAVAFSNSPPPAQPSSSVRELFYSEERRGEDLLSGLVKY